MVWNGRVKGREGGVGEGEMEGEWRWEGVVAFGSAVLKVKMCDL